MFNEAIKTALRTVIVFLKSKVETLGFMAMKMPFVFFCSCCNFCTFGSCLVCFVLIYLLFDLMLGFEMEVNNKTKDDGSAESPTSVLEDEVCFIFCFFALFGSRDYEGK